MSRCVNNSSFIHLRLAANLSMKLVELFIQCRRFGGKLFSEKSAYTENNQPKTPTKSMTTNKMQISGHSMGQELELPRRNNLTKITQYEARYDDCRKVPLSEKVYAGQNKRRKCQFRTNEGSIFSLTKRRKQSKPTPRQPSSAHLAPALSVQIPPRGVSCQHDGNIIY